MVKIHPHTKGIQSKVRAKHSASYGVGVNLKLLKNTSEAKCKNELQLIGKRDQKDYNPPATHTPPPICALI
jgi:hypothetical protein